VSSSALAASLSVAHCQSRRRPLSPPASALATAARVALTPRVLRTAPARVGRINLPGSGPRQPGGDEGPSSDGFQ
jgi:hypothetical protein